MYEFLKNLDRRWIFLLMGLAVGLPILLQVQFPETSSELAKAVFNEIEQLEEGDRVLLAFDFDPASEGELGPMATAFVRHCCEKKVKMYFLALWPVGPQMIDDTIEKVIKADFPNLVYGEDYVNLGYKSGQEGVIKVIVTDLRGLYTTDALGGGYRYRDRTEQATRDFRGLPAGRWVDRPSIRRHGPRPLDLARAVAVARRTNRTRECRG